MDEAAANFHCYKKRMSVTNGLIGKSFGKYANRRELYDMSSDITDKSKECCYCQSYKDCFICKAFFYLTAICKLGRHLAWEKNPKIKEF